MRTEEPRLTRRTLLIGGGLLALGVIIALGIPLVLLAITPHFEGSAYDDPPIVEDFSLSRADGGTFRLSDYRGRVVALYFGYTSCPDVCPTTLYDLRRTLEALGPDAGEVTVAFVTVDPATDTPERMTDYLSYFHPAFIGLLGTPAELQAVYDRFGVQVLQPEETAGGYGLAHTTSVFVLDRAGRLRLRLHYGASPESMARDLRILIKERGS